MKLQTIDLEVQVKEEEVEAGSWESYTERVPSAEPVASLWPQWFQAEQIVPLSKVAKDFSMSVQFSETETVWAFLGYFLRGFKSF